jgi:hypothetical protein
MNNFKKRRAYCHEESPAEPVLRDLSHHSSTGLDTSSLSADYRYILEQAPSTSVRITVPLSKLLDLNRQDHQQYILEQAASTLRVPLSVLLDLSNHQHHLHKRPRLDPSISMSTPYSDDPASQDGLEKASLAGPQGRDGSAERKPFAAFSETFPSGWTGSRLADCLASFSMCPPCSTYEPQPSTFLYANSTRRKPC